jgi:hypothetical protein
MDCGQRFASNSRSTPFKAALLPKGAPVKGLRFHDS